MEITANDLHGTPKIYEIPSWTTHVARDESGKLWAYDAQPSKCPRDIGYWLGFWHMGPQGTNVALIEDAPARRRDACCKDWENTLVEVQCPLR